VNSHVVKGVRTRTGLESLREFKSGHARVSRIVLVLIATASSFSPLRDIGVNWR